MSRVARLRQAGWSGLLCGLMVVTSGVGAQQVSGERLPGEKHVKPLTERERVLQALNRLTFGPRPGDVAAVESMGLQKWFEMELHPERIDDSRFGVEMGQFPAMGLPEDQLKERFPSAGMIRQMSRRGESIPSDPVERAIYADAEAVYDAKVENKAAAQGSVNSTRDDKAVTNGVPGMLADGGRLRVASAQNSVIADGIPEMPYEQVEAVLRLAPEERLGRLVGMTPGEMLGFREAVKGKDRVRLMAGLAPAQREAVEAMVESPERVVAAEDMEMRLLRDIDSQRQLQAVMTEFWLNHFNVYLRKNEQEPYMLPAYEQETVLPHALGKFEDLLVATAKSPAMLMYLDNWESIGPNSVAAGNVAVVQKARPNGKIAQKLPKGINENYGRELMELHTLGVGGGYTQQDVIEVAKCFTGWTIAQPYGGMGARARMAAEGTPGEFVFDPKRHEPGSKVVLGHTIPEGGMNEGLEVLHILATSPATARFISRELAVRFVSDNPPVGLVNRMAATYLKSGGDIGAVLTTMFRAKEFWAPGVYRAKVKTPLEFLASAVRASGASVTNPRPLVQAMDRLGMPVWGMQTPNGYGWTAEDWVSSNGLLSRMNFALVLSGNRVAGTKTDWAGVLGGPAEASAETERLLEGDLLGESASVRTRAAVMAEFGNPTAQAQAADGFVGRPAAGAAAAPGMGGGMVRAAAVQPGKVGSAVKQSEVPLDTMAGLLMGSPEFQRR
jgi:uncharacterized protein (DUF1800 family)